MNRIAVLNSDLKYSIEQIRPNNSKILAVQEVLTHCFNSSVARAETANCL